MTGSDVTFSLFTLLLVLFTLLLVLFTLLLVLAMAEVLAGYVRAFKLRSRIRNGKAGADHGN